VSRLRHGEELLELRVALGALELDQRGLVLRARDVPALRHADHAVRRIACRRRCSPASYDPALVPARRATNRKKPTELRVASSSFETGPVKTTGSVLERLPARLEQATPLREHARAIGEVARRVDADDRFEARPGKRQRPSRRRAARNVTRSARPSACARCRDVAIPCALTSMPVTRPPPSSARWIAGPPDPLATSSTLRALGRSSQPTQRRNSSAVVQLFWPKSSSKRLPADARVDLGLELAVHPVEEVDLAVSRRAFPQGGRASVGASRGEAQSAFARVCAVSHRSLFARTRPCVSGISTAGSTSPARGTVRALRSVAFAHRDCVSEISVVTSRAHVDARVPPRSAHDARGTQADSHRVQDATRQSATTDGNRRAVRISQGSATHLRRCGASRSSPTRALRCDSSPFSSSSSRQPLSRSNL
jgi:hypothetical protein